MAKDRSLTDVRAGGDLVGRGRPLVLTHELVDRLQNSLAIAPAACDTTIAVRLTPLALSKGSPLARLHRALLPQIY